MRISWIFCIGILCSCTGIQPRYHTVREGETLRGIAKAHSVPVAELTRYNRDNLQDGFHSGEKLYLPLEESYYTLPENAQTPSRVRAYFSWPLSGYISSPFGKRRNRFHEGIDIPAPHGTSVKASRSGHVIYAGNKIQGYGNMAIVRHADEYSTVYAHLSKLNVKKGDFISRGQPLGRVGRTGRARGTHLHFEIREHRLAVNPLLYLQGPYAHNILGRKQ